MTRMYLTLAVVCAMAVAFAGSAFADGTETLGPPSVPIASGTGVVVAGAGTQAFPDVNRTFSLNVPAGATIKQVLLYWEGHWTDHAPHPSNTPQVDGDNVVSLNGNAVVGTKVGGSTGFFIHLSSAGWGTERFVAYRADVTSLGLVSAGSNTLTIGNMSFGSNFPLGGSAFNQGNDGAGVIVVYEDGSDSTLIDLRDGLDLAFKDFLSPLDTTVPQTFSFTASAANRPASLATLAGSVSGPDLAGVRGNILRVGFDVGGSADIVNPWQSSNGDEFDAVDSNIVIPAGASSMTVQALSEGGDRPASLGWIAATLTIENPPSGGGEGCTPGYWKNHDGSKKTNAWAATPYTTGQLLSTVFSPTGLGSLGSYTLRQALDFKGGSTLLEKKQLLLHHAVAALLNAAHSGVAYPMTVAQITSAVNAALESNDEASIVALKDQLDRQNNAGCSLGRAG